MVSEWRSYPLGLLTKWSSGGTPSKSKEEYWNGGIPWISASSMDGSRYSNSKLKITRAGLDNGSRLAKKGSVLLLVRGSILHQKIQVGIAEKDVAFNQDVKCLVANDKYIDQWFLLYWLKAHERKLLSIVENTGIGAGKLDTKILQKLDVKVPPDEIRYKIVSFVKSLDDKIELNKKINQTLEQMAQALFKSWFVDFDPVFDNLLDKHHNNLEKAKAYLESKGAEDLCPKLTKRFEQRQQTKDQKPLPQDIRNLFPSHFHHNQDLGWIPEGWVNGSLGVLADALSGYAFKSRHFSESGYGVIKIKNINSDSTVDEKNLQCIPVEVALNHEKFLLSRGDVVMAMTGATVGKHGVITGAAPLLLNQRVCKLIPKEISDYSYLKTLLSRTETEDWIVNTAQGSAQPNISATSILSLPIVVPKQDQRKAFDGVVRSFYNQMIENRIQLTSLTLIRDLILPKLISGELRLESHDKAQGNQS